MLNPSIAPNGFVRYLGIIFEKCTNMYEHVKSPAYYHLKNIHSLKESLTQEALATVVHAFVTSRIDYCNSLLVRLTEWQILEISSYHLNSSKPSLVTSQTAYPFQDFSNK